ALELIREKNHIVFAVDTLAYLVKNGRLSNAQGFLGSMLNAPLRDVMPYSQAAKYITIRDGCQELSENISAVKT
ncbi:MAG: DegV family protein, partial [Fidelibacterota bacterium]